MSITYERKAGPVSMRISCGTAAELRATLQAIGDKPQPGEITVRGPTVNEITDVIQRGKRNEKIGGTNGVWPSEPVYVVFTEKPGNPDLTFVEVENTDGKSIEFGEMIRYGEGLVALKIMRTDFGRYGTRHDSAFTLLQDIEELMADRCKTIDMHPTHNETVMAHNFIEQLRVLLHPEYTANMRTFVASKDEPVKIEGHVNDFTVPRHEYNGAMLALMLCRDLKDFEFGKTFAKTGAFIKRAETIVEIYDGEREDPIKDAKIEHPSTPRVWEPAPGPTLGPMQTRDPWPDVRMPLDLVRLMLDIVSTMGRIDYIGEQHQTGAYPIRISGELLAELKSVMERLRAWPLDKPKEEHDEMDDYHG